jgi:hypothetical protein
MVTSSLNSLLVVGLGPAPTRIKVMDITGDIRRTAQRPREWRIRYSWSVWTAYDSSASATLSMHYVPRARGHGNVKNTL